MMTKKNRNERMRKKKKKNGRKLSRQISEVYDNGTRINQEQQGQISNIMVVQVLKQTPLSGYRVLFNSVVDREMTD